MKKRALYVVLAAVALCLTGGVLYFLYARHYLSLSFLKTERDMLIYYAQAHPIDSMIVYILISVLESIIGCLSRPWRRFINHF